MHFLGCDERARQRPDGTGIDLGLGLAGKLADFAGIGLRQLQRHVSGDGGNADDVELRAAERQQNGDGIILAGIRVDDDLTGLGHFNSLSGESFWAGLATA